jgi:hypothetical protein
MTRRHKQRQKQRQNKEQNQNQNPRATTQQGVANMVAKKHSVMFAGNKQAAPCCHACIVHVRTGVLL